MDSDQLQAWIAGSTEATALHLRLINTLQEEAEKHSTLTGERSPTDQPILTTAACRAMIDTSAGGGIYQALRRLVRSSLPTGQSIADWFWHGVMEAQYSGLVSGDADRGKKGSTAGLTARAQWRDSIGLQIDTWAGLEHKAWETVLYLQGNDDLDVLPHLSSAGVSSFHSRMKYYLRGAGSTSAMDALLWTLVGSWGLLIDDWPDRLDTWNSADWEATIQYYSALGYDTADLVFTGTQIQGWQRASLPAAPDSTQYLVHWCSGWTDVVRTTVAKYGRECLAIDIRQLGDAHEQNIQLNLLSVSPQFLRHEVARLAHVQLSQLRENLGGADCTTFAKSDSSNRRVRKRGRDAGQMKWDNYRDASDPLRGPMHPASVEKGVAARSGDRLSEAMLWVFQRSGESWAMENPEGQLRFRPHMQKVDEYKVRADWCRLWDRAERDLGFEWEKSSNVWTSRWDGSIWDVGDELKCKRRCKCADRGTTPSGRSTYTHRESVENPMKAMQRTGLSKEACKCRYPLGPSPPLTVPPAGIPGD